MSNSRYWSAYVTCMHDLPPLLLVWLGDDASGGPEYFR